MTALPDPTDHAPAAPERLAKRVARMVPCSRREAEQYIEGGWVRVDGVVVEEPQFRVLHHTVALDQNASLLTTPPVTLLLHKPPDHDAGSTPPARHLARPSAWSLLTPAAHAASDTSGTRVLKRHFSNLTAPVELEYAASGVSVYTQDWRVARKLTDDAHLLEHELIVDIAGEAAPELLQQISQGRLAGAGALPLVRVSVNSTAQGHCKLRFAVRGAHPGLVAYLCERVGWQMLGMRRIRIGRVLLGALPVAQWRYLLPHERF